MAKYFTSNNKTQVAKPRFLIDVNQTPSSPPGKVSSPVPKVVSILGAAPQHDHSIAKRGWIHKKSKHFKNYHKRFMILKGDTLLCYKHQPPYGKATNNETPTETFDLSLHRYRIDKHDTVKEKFYLIDETISSSRSFKAPSEVDRDDWVYNITNSIISGRNLRQSSVKQLEEYYGGSNKNTKIMNMEVATFESQMVSDGDTNWHDSESEESDNDFGGYSSHRSLSVFGLETAGTITKSSTFPSTDNDEAGDGANNLSAQPVPRRRQTISNRKTNQPISKASFLNFRIRSLTVEKSSGSAFGSDESDDDAALDMGILDEEKEEFDDEDDADVDEERDDDFKVTEELACMAVLESDEETDGIKKLEKMMISRGDIISMNNKRQQSNSTLFGLAISSLEMMDKSKSKSCEEPEDDGHNNNKQGQVQMQSIREYKEETIAQLEMFGYGRDEIIKAMECVVNANDINMVRDKLDEDKNKEEDNTIDEQLRHIKMDAPETPELYANSSTKSYMSSSTDDLMTPSSKISIDQNGNGNVNGANPNNNIFAQVEWTKKPSNNQNYRGIIKTTLSPTIEEDYIFDPSSKSKSVDHDIAVDPKLAKQAKQAKKRKFIEQEIITTEETYVDGLNTLLTKLIQPIFDNGYVDKKYYDQIRSSSPKIYEFHKNFLEKLREVYRQNHAENIAGGESEDIVEVKNRNKKTLASVFNNCIKDHRQQFMEMYIEFIKDYDGILDLFGTTFHGNVELAEFLTAKRKERKPLSGFLIIPVQRIPRYILLLTDLKANTEKDCEDYQDIHDAVEMIRDITNEINEKKRKIENLSQCLQIQEALTGLKQPIIEENRMFIDQFIFIKKEIKHQRLFFVFNDVLIIANEKWKVKHILDMRTLEVKIKVDGTKKKGLPEFKLISTGAGSVIYVGKDMKDLNKFKRLIGKWRVKIMSGDIRQRNGTITGDVKDELGRQALLYD